MSAEQDKTIPFPPHGLDEFIPAVAKGEWNPKRIKVGTNMKKILYHFVIFIYIVFEKMNPIGIIFLMEKNVKGFRGYKMETFPWNAWKIENEVSRHFLGKMEWILFQMNPTRILN